MELFVSISPASLTYKLFYEHVEFFLKLTPETVLGLLWFEFRSWPVV